MNARPSAAYLFTTGRAERGAPARVINLAQVTSRAGALYLFSVAPIANLSVSPEIVAAREDFFNHGWTRINTDEDGFSLIRVHPCSSVVGSYWLRRRNQSSADWESAVSWIGNPQTFADCQSAKQQIDNLRYEKSSRGATISADTDADTDRLAVCATNTTEALKRYGALRSKGSPFAPDPCGAR